VAAHLNETALRRALRSAGLPDGSVRYEEVTASTNATALEMARAGAPEWTVVAAAHQYAGRGRLGRTWDSVPGDSLLFSVVLRPRLPPDRAVLLTLLAGVSMALACRVAGVDDVWCKWPNDLLRGDAKVGDPGRGGRRRRPHRPRGRGGRRQPRGPAGGRSGRRRARRRGGRAAPGRVPRGPGDPGRPSASSRSGRSGCTGRSARPSAAGSGRPRPTATRSKARPSTSARTVR
jgi:hypothetical protein